MDVIVRVQQERRNVEQKIPALRKELAELEKADKYQRQELTFHGATYELEGQTML